MKLYITGFLCREWGIRGWLVDSPHEESVCRKGNPWVIGGFPTQRVSMQKGESVGDWWIPHTKSQYAERGIRGWLVESPHKESVCRKGNPWVIGGFPTQRVSMQKAFHIMMPSYWLGECPKSEILNFEKSFLSFYLWFLFNHVPESIFTWTFLTCMHTQFFLCLFPTW